MKEKLKIASVFIGTIVGAGLASGQEILQFFAKYGPVGFVGITICCLMYIGSFVIIIQLCTHYGCKSYKDIVHMVLGSIFGPIVDVLLTVFIFGSSIIMISGGGAMLKEYANFPYYVGIFIMCFLVFITAIFSTQGIITLNSVIVPFSAATITILGILVIMKTGTQGVDIVISSAAYDTRSPWPSAILYSSFNILGATGVICPMIYETKEKKHFLPGCIIGSTVLTILAFLICFSILVYAPGSMRSEIPNLYIAKGFGKLFPFLLTMVIWLEMFSTEISDVYSLSKRLEYSFKLSYPICVIVIMGITIPFSFIGFSRLIKLLYPPFGAVSFIFILGCIVKYIKYKRNALK